MKSWVFLIIWLMPLSSALAQFEPPSSYGAASVNLGIARRADTSALEITLGGWYGSPVNGPFLDFAAGADWVIGHGTPYDILDADLGFSIRLEPRGQTSLLLRAGGSWWGKNDRTNGFGGSGGFELRHFFSAGRGWNVNFRWRRFSGFTAPSLTAGLVLRSS
jgi:hypothetical protein